MIKNFLISCFTIGLISCQLAEKESINLQPVPIENTTDRIWNSGWLSVHENRTNPASKFIQLPFIQSKASDSLNTKKTPVLIMSGGPGNSSLHMANGVVNTPWGKDRDIVVLEQRGTFHAKPSLTCPEIDSLRIQGLKNGLWGQSMDSLKMQGVQYCYERLTTQNIDLNGYNSLESVEDIEALRKALSIDRMILYGMSYSCNLMTAYAQIYPQHAKALILDSPLPHHVNYDEDAYQNIDSVLINVIEHYSGSKQLYDQWKSYLSSVHDSVFQVTLNSKLYQYTKNELVDIILLKMSDHQSLQETTISIEKLLEGNHEEITEIINYYLTPTRQALGMRYSLWVGEELTEENEDKIEEQKDLYSWLHDYPVNDVSFETAKIWKIKSLYENRDWPSESFNGHAIILSGQFDPWTPKWYGSMMLEYLPNAKHIIYPESTHLPGFTKNGFDDISEFISQID
jgi:pimeloyl-ACP methyl ester carboxylesterase